jgi:hypothetical protein
MKKNIIGFLFVFFVSISAQTVNFNIPNRTTPPGAFERTMVTVSSTLPVKGIDMTIVFSDTIRQRWNYYFYSWDYGVNTTTYGNNDTFRVVMVSTEYPLIGSATIVSFPYALADYMSEGTKKRLNVSMKVAVDMGSKDTLIKAVYSGGYITTGPAISMYGDVYRDNAYDLMDIMKTRDISHREGIFNLLDSLYADVSGDGSVDSWDQYEVQNRVTNPWYRFERQDAYYGGEKGRIIGTTVVPANVVLTESVKGVSISLGKNDSLIRNSDIYVAASVKPQTTDVLNGSSWKMTYSGGKSHLSFVKAEGMETEKPILFLPGVRAENVKIYGMINNEVPVNLVIQRTTGISEKLATPTEFSLSQNYPNPFNPSTKISFSLPQSVKVMLKVYDMLGRDVKTLVDGELSAGNHEAVFNASGLSSGIYIYRLVAGNFTETKRMNLLK